MLIIEGELKNKMIDITYEKTYKPIKAKKNEKIVFIEGLPGIGNVGKIAVDFLIDKTKSVKIINIGSDTYPPSVYINENNLVELPEVAVYYKKIKNNHIYFLSGDVQPFDERPCFEFTNALLVMIRKLGVQEIITIGGIGMREIPQKPKVYVTSSTAAFLEEMKKYKVKTKIYGVVGPIIGVTGLLVGLSKQYKIKAAALLAETYAHPMYMGIKGAREVLQVLKDRYGFVINLADLDNEIKAIEKEVSKIQHLSPSKDQKVNYIG